MTDPWHYRAFALDEHRARVDRARDWLATAELAGCICTAPELLYYFTGYDAHTHHVVGSQAMVLSTVAEDPILILRDGDVPQAQETVVLGDVRSFRFGATALACLVRDAVRDLGIAGWRMGLDIEGPTTNGALTHSILAALGDVDHRDCWWPLGMLRTVLSEAEIAYLREATEYANAGIDAFHRAARPGISEIELAAEIEYAIRSAGSDYSAVPTWLDAGERARCQHAMASPRRIEAGDLVHAEFAGVARRYQSVTMGSLVLGEPTERMGEMAQAGKAAFAAGLEAARVGGRIGDMEIAYRAVLEEFGMGDCCPMRFGVGLSAGYPPIWENSITIQHENDRSWMPGMAFYIHASMQSFRDGNGMLLGGSFLMTEDGPERLDKAPIDLVVIDL